MAGLTSISQATNAGSWSSAQTQGADRNRTLIERAGHPALRLPLVIDAGGLRGLQKKKLRSKQAYAPEMVLFYLRDVL